MVFIYSFYKHHIVGFIETQHKKDYFPDKHCSYVQITDNTSTGRSCFFTSLLISAFLLELVNMRRVCSHIGIFIHNGVYRLPVMFFSNSIHITLSLHTE